MVKKLLPPDWYNFLGGDKYFQGPFKELGKKIAATSKGKTFYPSPADSFLCFKLCPVKDIKVVIVGQDPYHDGSATGLAFANRPDKFKVSPSLRMIMECLETMPNIAIAETMDITLQSWAKQGVLLLNSALTVEKGKAGSHTEIWKPFTTRLINALVNTRAGDPIIFVMLGKQAQQFITANMEFAHDVFRIAHPAADLYSGKRLFRDSRIFEQINDRLKFAGKEPINYLKQLHDFPETTS